MPRRPLSPVSPAPVCRAVHPLALCSLVSPLPQATSDAGQPCAPGPLRLLLWGPAAGGLPARGCAAGRGGAGRAAGRRPPPPPAPRPARGDARAAVPAEHRGALRPGELPPAGPPLTAPGSPGATRRPVHAGLRVRPPLECPSQLPLPLGRRVVTQTRVVRFFSRPHLQTQRAPRQLQTGATCR